MKNVEIAQMLQVSTATVSLALNNKPGVSEETRRKILELKNAALKNDAAQISRMQNKGMIGLFVFKKRRYIIAETQFFVQLITAIDAGASENSYKLNIAYFSSDDLQENIEQINRSGLAGLVVIATEMAEEDVRTFREQVQVPFVMADASFVACNVDCVLMDNRSGIFQAVKYGYEMGHRKIGFINSSQECNNFLERYHSFCAALTELGLPVEERYFFSVSPNVKDARKDMEQILKTKPELPSLLIAANDQIAIGAMDAIKSAGYDVPTDVSIIGFDDMSTVQYLTPPLTSVHLPYKRIARVALNRLIEKIEKPEDNDVAMQQFLEVQLVIRDSVMQLKNP